MLLLLLLLLFDDDDDLLLLLPELAIILVATGAAFGDVMEPVGQVRLGTKIECTQQSDTFKQNISGTTIVRVTQKPLDIVRREKERRNNHVCHQWCRG